jgi:thiosulfate/3-mercaptopyruvate sulfurtransferase
MIPPVVDAAWTAARLEELVLADVRWYLDGRPGRAEYDRGHLPGAVFVELDDWLAAPASPQAGRHPLPDPEVFARGMAELGIGDGDTVVAYDDQGGVVAARLVWMLRVTGREAALLDGGIAAWDGALETAPAARPPATFTARPWPAEALASADDAADPANAVIDARQRERYIGAGPDPVDPRAGHIPGARSLPVREHLRPDGRLLDRETLRERFAAAGVDGSQPVVSYCGSGVTACHNLVVLEHAGLDTGRLYAGSWSQWSHDPERPAATGEEPA